MLTAHQPEEDVQAVDAGPQSRLTMIARMTAKLSRSLDFGEALKELVAGATDLLGVGRGALMLLDHDTRTLTISAAKGIDEETIRSTRIQVGFGIAGAVAETGKPLLQKVARKPGTAPNADRPDSGLCVPVAIHGKLLGVMGFEDKKTADRFDRADLEFAQLVADQAAVALYCDLLHEEFQEELTEDGDDTLPVVEEPPAEQRFAA